jgi:hypothetical protein
MLLMGPLFAYSRAMASVAVWAFLLLISCIPGAMALVAYEVGGTSLWAAIAFAVAVPAVGWFSAFRRPRPDLDEQEELLQRVPPEMREELRSRLRDRRPSRWSRAWSRTRPFRP